MIRRAAALVLVLAVLAGCGQLRGGKGEGMDPRQQLEQRPRESEMEERYLRVLTTFQERVASKVGVSWDKSPSRTGAAGCREPFSGLGAVTFNIRGGASVEDFDMADWPAVEAIADDIAQAEGFTAEKVVVVDEPDLKKVSWVDEYGSELEVGAQQVLVPAIYGACVLP